MKLLVVTTREDRSRDLITEASRRKGIETIQMYYEDMDPLRISVDDFKGYDFCITRDPYNTGKDFSFIMKRITSFFINKQLLDYKVYNENPRYEDKLFQHEIFGDIMKMPGFRHFSDPDDVSVDSFPVVAKKRISSRGRGIFIIRDIDEMKRFVNSVKVDEYFFEDHIKIKNDIRVLIIGGEIVGSVERKIRYHTIFFII